MKQKLLCLLLVLALAISVAVGVHASEEGAVCVISGLETVASYDSLDAALAANHENVSCYKLTKDLSGGTISQDMLLDLNGYDLTGVTVAEGVTVQLMDSANDQYEAEKCGSLSGTVNGTVEQVVKHNANTYLVIENNGVYSAHRFYAGITHISLVPSMAALGYKAEYYADAVINEMVTGYGYQLWINDHTPRQYMNDTSIANHVLTLRLKNILVEDNAQISDIGATASINGNAVIRFHVDGQELTVTGADHSTTLKDTVEAVNEALGQNRSAYTTDQVALVREMYNKFSAYMNGWQVNHILAVEKFAPQSVDGLVYGQSVTLGQLFAAVESEYPIGTVVATVNGEEITVAENWADTVLFLNAGTAVITITDNDHCIAATNTVEVAKADPEVEPLPSFTATYGQTLAEMILPEGYAWVDPNQTVGNVGMNYFAAIYTPADPNYNAIETSVGVVVEKADPAYTVPENLTAVYGQRLEEIALPEGFYWENSSEEVGQVGTSHHYAYYMPSDTENFNTINHIEIYITVAKADPVVPEIGELIAYYGDEISSIYLMDHQFTWESTGPVGDVGTHTYYVTYTPQDYWNYNIVEHIPVTVRVEPAMPQVPQLDTLQAYYGQTLADIALPEGFSWEDPTLSVGDVALKAFNAWYDTKDPNYMVAPVSVSVLVSPADPEYTIPNDLTAIYGQDVSEIALPEGFAWESTGSVGNAGESVLFVSYTPADTTNYNKITGIMVTVTVAKADTVCAEPMANPWTYDGAEHSLVYGETVMGGTMVYSLDGVGYQEGVPTAINAGTYTVYCMVRGDENHNDSEVKTVTVTVEKANAQLLISPSASYLTYNGAAQELVFGGMAEGGTMVYSMDGVSYTETVPTATDAGSYTVYYMVRGDENHNDWGVSTVTVEIAKAETEVPAVGTLNATYGDDLSTVTLPDGFTWKSTGSVGNAGINSFVAIYNNGDANYNTAEVTVSVEVAKAEPEVPAVGTLNATYGQTLTDVALPSGFTWESTGSVGSAGDNQFTVTYTPVDSENYNVVTGIAVTVTVAKADPPYEIPTGLTATEGDALSTIALTDGFAWVDGSVEIALGENTYAATFTPVDTTNYNTVTVQIVVTGEAKAIVDKFAQKMPEADFTYRLGNMNTVALGSLFKALDGVDIDSASVTVTVTVVDGIGVSGAYTANTSDWTKGTIQFTGTGVVNVTIQESYSNPVTLTFEIVNAKNATSAASATANNVVLLNDCGFSTLEVSNGYTLFGNGFTLSNPSDLTCGSMSDAYVALINGTLDNVKIICPNYSLSIMYQNQAQVDGNVDANAEWRYHNYRSAVGMEGNSKIYNSYISGGRAAVNIMSGYALLDNTMVVGGATANIQVGSIQQLTLRDMTMVQMPIQATVNNTSASRMGFGVVFTCDGASGAAAPLVLEGYLHQYAWANESYKSYVPSGAETILNVVMKQTDYIHNISLNGETAQNWLNLGIAYMPADLNQSAAAPTIIDNRTDKDRIPYDTVTMTVLNTTTYVYSYKNTNRDGVEVENVPVYEQPDSGVMTVPQVSFTDAGTGIELSENFDEQKGWTSVLKLDLDTLGAYSFNFNDLVTSKYGKELSYTVTDADGNEVDKNTPISLSSSGVYNYVLHITDNADCNNEPEKAYVHEYAFNLTATMTSIAKPEKVADVGGEALLVVKSKDSDWSCALPALEGTQIKYWSTTDRTYKTLTLSDLTPASTGKQNGTNNFWTYTGSDFTLTVTCGVIHEGKSVYGMPVVVDNNGTKQMYFTISSTTGYVSSGTTARNVTVSYEFKDNNGGTLTFNKAWNCVRQNMIDAGATQYIYSDFVNGTLTDAAGSSSGGCVTPETLITLADGSQIRVDQLTGAEELLVWNMETGKLDSAPIMFVDSETESEYEVVHLYFSDGTDVKVIYEHGFWDYDLNRYVYLDANAAQYIGHTFAKQNGNELARVQLVDVVIETEVTTAWSPVTAGHLCYFVNGMLSMPGGVGGLFNIFDVDAETMTYDYEAMARDIETYGLFTYEELNSIVPLPEEMFEAAGGAYLKISIGKGNLTMEELVAMIQRYTVYFQ